MNKEYPSAWKRINPHERSESKLQPQSSGNESKSGHGQATPTVTALRGAPLLSAVSEPRPSDSVSQAGTVTSEPEPTRTQGFLPTFSEAGTGSINRDINVIGTGSDTATAAAMMLNFAAMNNPLMSQIVMGASQPKFRGTAENFPEFRRKWQEYLRLVKSSYPVLGKGPNLNLLKACLDSASCIRFQRELDDNPELSAGNSWPYWKGTLEKTSRCKLGKSGHP